MNPAFKYKKLKTLVPLFAQAAEKLLRYTNPLASNLSCSLTLLNSNWERNFEKGPTKVEEGITAMTLDVIGKLYHEHTPEHKHNTAQYSTTNATQTHHT